MPEGDTIYRAASRLRPLLEQKRITAARSRNPQFDAGSLVERTIETVEARGKHLLFHFEDGRALHSHMGMTGSWHIYHPGEAWQKPERLAELVLETEQYVFPCFTPCTLEILSADALRRHAYLNRLGPDLLGSSQLDQNEVVRRFRIHNPTPIGQAVMNQTIVSGIGNIYKSEVLFLLRVHPLTKVEAFSDEQILAVTLKAQELMQQNLGGYPRTTRRTLSGSRFWVYGRTGQPCFECGAPIQVIRQGDLGRTTFFCPQCQGERGASAPDNPAANKPHHRRRI